MKGASRLAALTLLALLAGCREEAPAAKMRTIALRGGRSIEARLTGFAWSPMRVQRGAPALDPARLELAGAAGAVIEKTPTGRDAGVGYLIIDRDADAVEALQDAAQQSPGDAKIWSDLAAARYTLAVRGEKSYELPRALAAADHALRIDSNLTDALFNRALIIERIGITEAARRAWQRYLQADGTSKWAIEAQQHLGRLPVTTTDAEFRRDLARATAAMAHGDAAPLAALSRTYPQEARKWGEGPLLAGWADAVRAGDTAKAKAELDVVRVIGITLTESNNEHLLADAVAAIDRAASDPQRLRVIADAQAAYRDGRVLYSKRRIVEAEKELQRSVDAFEQGGSAMAGVARYYLASATFDDNRIDEAFLMLRALQSRIDTSRYRALDAQIQWEISLCAMAKGAWAIALRAAAEASRTFAALDEPLNRAQTDQLSAEMFAHMAQPRAAWKLWSAVFPVLSRAGAYDRITNVLASIIQSETERGEYESALALAGINADDAHVQPHVAAFANANRARLLAMMDDPAAAQAAASAARGYLAAVPDAAMRTRAAVFVDIAEGVAVRATDLRRSKALFDGSLAFLGSRSDHRLLPDVYLQRGRTLLRLGDETAALADFEAGIGELDAQRSTVDEGILRGGFYDSAPDLFAETIALFLRRNDVPRAFAYADAARARSLREQLDSSVAKPQAMSIDAIRQSLPPDGAFLEYALLDDAVVIFTVTPKGADAVRVPIPSRTLRASVEHFRDLLQQRAPVESVQAEGARLRRILIDSVGPRLAAARRLIVVPDRELHAVAFSALYDPAARRYLVDECSISVVPSAAFLLRSSGASALGSALVIGDPKADGGPALPEAAREAQLIAGMYDSATLLIGERATRARFIEAAQRSAVIHYAGHAESDDGQSYGTLRLAEDDAHRSGALDAGEIARLKLPAAPLVVLAACGTIRGETNHIEGMPSVARAFLAAGARDVIGTLWEIDDDIAARLFRKIHEHLRAGMSPATALQAAQLDLARDGDGRLRHPSSWAAVEILGR